MEQKLDYEHRLTQVETRVETLEDRQNNLDKLVSTVSALAAREERVELDVKEIKADVKTLTEKPAKRYDGLVDKAVWAVLAAIIAFVLGRIGL